MAGKILFDCDVDIQAAEGSGRGVVSMVAYTGGPLRVSSYDAPVYLDINGTSGIERPIPLLRDHERNRIIGTVQASLRGRVIHADGHLVGDSEDRKQVEELAKDGFEWRAEAGARPIELKRIRAGQSASVNGRIVEGPAYVASQWRLAEVSVVVIPTFGPGTTSRVTVAAADTGKTKPRVQPIAKVGKKSPAVDWKAFVEQERERRLAAYFEFEASKRTTFPISVADELRESLKKKRAQTRKDQAARDRAELEKLRKELAEDSRERLRAKLQQAKREGMIKRELQAVKRDIQQDERAELERLREESRRLAPQRIHMQQTEYRANLEAARERYLARQQFIERQGRPVGGQH